MRTQLFVVFLVVFVIVFVVLSAAAFAGLRNRSSRLLP